MTLETLIALARKHIGSGTMESSARLCLDDAVALKESGDLFPAWYRALRSLDYSVGVFHPDYVRALAAQYRAEEDEAGQRDLDEIEGRTMDAEPADRADPRSIVGGAS